MGKTPDMAINTASVVPKLPADIFIRGARPVQRLAAEIGSESWLIREKKRINRPRQADRKGWTSITNGMDVNQVDPAIDAKGSDGGQLIVKE